MDDRTRREINETHALSDALSMWRGDVGRRYGLTNDEYWLMIERHDRVVKLLRWWYEGLIPRGYGEGYKRG